MDRETFFTGLSSRLYELGVGEEYVNKYVRQFERYFNTMTDEEAEEQLNSFDGVDGIARNIVGLIKKKEAKDVAQSRIKTDAAQEAPTITYNAVKPQAKKSDGDTRVIDTVKINESDTRSADKAKTESSQSESTVSIKADIDSDIKLAGQTVEQKPKKPMSAYMSPVGDFIETDTDIKKAEVNAEAETDEITENTGTEENALAADETVADKDTVDNGEDVSADGSGSDEYEKYGQDGDTDTSEDAESAIADADDDLYAVDGDYIIGGDEAENTNQLDEKQLSRQNIKAVLLPADKPQKRNASNTRREEAREDDYEESPEVNFNELDEQYERENDAPNTVLYWALVILTAPITIPLIAAVLAAFGAVFAGMAVAIVALIIALIGIIIAGTAVSLVGIIYGVTQIFVNVPAGLFEIGLGVVVGGTAMLSGILIYNFAIRFLPFAMKYLGVFFNFVMSKIKYLYRLVKRECAKQQ